MGPSSEYRETSRSPYCSSNLGSVLLLESFEWGFCFDLQCLEILVSVHLVFHVGVRTREQRLDIRIRDHFEFPRISNLCSSLSQPICHV